MIIINMKVLSLILLGVQCALSAPDLKNRYEPNFDLSSGLLTGGIYSYDQIEEYRKQHQFPTARFRADNSNGNVPDVVKDQLKNLEGRVTGLQWDSSYSKERIEKMIALLLEAEARQNNEIKIKVVTVIIAASCFCIYLLRKLCLCIAKKSNSKKNSTRSIESAKEVP